MMLIGIDPGVDTGFAIWDAKAQKLVEVKSDKIHNVMRDTVHFVRRVGPAVVLFEDARRRKWFGNADQRQAKYGASVREGVGSIKRDSVIWEDFLTDMKIPFEARNPVTGGTKWDAVYFKAATKWMDRTNEHSRDAACQVFGLSLPWAMRAYTECVARLNPPVSRAATSSRS